MDQAWEWIYLFFIKAATLLDTALSPLEILGPGFVIFFLSLSIVLVTRVISKFYVTQRYITLKEEFEHWKHIRDEALKHPDKEKGKRLARNVDKAELNKVYYDFFFEGLLKNFITNVIPILFMASYITTVYTPETLMERFGRKWVFSVSFGSSPVNFSSFFWFVISIILSFLLFFIIKKVIKKKYAATKTD